MFILGFFGGEGLPPPFKKITIPPFQTAAKLCDLTLFRSVQRITNIPRKLAFI